MDLGLHKQVILNILLAFFSEETALNAAFNY